MICLVLVAVQARVEEVQAGPCVEVVEEEVVVVEREEVFLLPRFPLRLVLMLELAVLQEQAFQLMTQAGTTE